MSRAGEINWAGALLTRLETGSYNLFPWKEGSDLWRSSRRLPAMP